MGDPVRDHGSDQVTLVSSRGPVVYVHDVDHPELGPDDLHHLQRVVRLRQGDALVVCDGRGRWRPAMMDAGASGGAKVVAGLVCTAPARFEPRPERALTLSVALPKGERADWLLQKATELGIDAFVLVETDHSVVRSHQDNGSRVRARLERVIRAAGAQSRRTWLPELSGPYSFAQVTAGAVAAGPAAGGNAGVVLAQPGGGPITRSVRNVMIGPEGGWSATELGVGLPTVGLGPQVLRVETAALAASTLLVALRSRLVLDVDSAGENALGG